MMWTLFVLGMWGRLLSMTPDELWDYPNPVKGQMSDDLIWAFTNAARSALGVLAHGGEYQVTHWMARDFPQVKQRMAADLAVIKGRVLVVGESYEKAPDLEATWFIDPPYQHLGRWYGANNSTIEFSTLGVWCRSRTGQVIVTEAAPADWLPFSPHRIGQNQVNTSAVELIWESDPAPTLLDLV